MIDSEPWLPHKCVDISTQTHVHTYHTFTKCKMSELMNEKMHEKNNCSLLEIDADGV